MDLDSGDSRSSATEHGFSVQLSDACVHNLQRVADQPSHIHQPLRTQEVHRRGSAWVRHLCHEGCEYLDLAVLILHRAASAFLLIILLTVPTQSSRYTKKMNSIQWTFSSPLSCSPSALRTVRRKGYYTVLSLGWYPQVYIFLPFMFVSPVNVHTVTSLNDFGYMDY